MDDRINMWTCGFASACAAERMADGRFVFAAIYAFLAISAIFNIRRDAKRRTA